MLQLWRDRGSLAPHEIWSALAVSKQGAMDLIKPVLAAGIVIREGTRKSGRYRLKNAL